MTKFRCIYLPIAILFVFLFLYPVFAHPKPHHQPPEDCNSPPKEPKQKPYPPPPQKPQKPCPPPPQKPKKPYPPPPEAPKQTSPPQEPKQKPPPPQEPKQKPPPPQEPKENPPQEPKQKPPPPQEPKQKPPPPQEPKQKPPPPQEPKQTPPPQEPKQKSPPPQEPKQKPPPPQEPKQNPPQEPKQKPPPPQEPKQKPPQEPKQKPPPPQETKQTPPPQEPKQKSPPPQEPKQKPPPPQEPKENPPQEPKQKPPPPQEPKQKPPPPQEPTQDQPQKPTQFHNRFKGHFSTVFAFGDSYTDTGNAQFLGSLTLSFSGSLSSPYGSTTFGKTSNRLSNGRLVLDFITDSLGLPVLPPYQSTSSNFTHGVNFAIAGATTVANDLFSKLARVFLWKGTPLGIMTQLDWYKKFQVDHICKDLDQKACADKLKTVLFWVGEIGITDYSRAVGSKIPLPSIAKSSVAYTIELVRTLIRNGAKNIVVQGLPPLGCLPLDISLTPLSIRDRSGCSPIVNGAVLIHNQILQAKLEIFRKLYPDVTLIYADSWKAYFTIVNNPQKYQIQETHKTCCGATGQPDDLNFNLQSLCGASGTSICDDPSKYISWDGIHPTESMNSHMTDQFINQGCCHPPFEELMKNSVAM